MAEALARGSRITGDQRGSIAAEYVQRYNSGESIRTIADAAGRSFGFVHGLLKESGIELRGRGGATRGAGAPSAGKRTPPPRTSAKPPPAEGAPAAPAAPVVEPEVKAKAAKKVKTKKDDKTKDKKDDKTKAKKAEKAKKDDKSKKDDKAKDKTGKKH